ncbi:F-type H+-transporting ATPase subunit delta [Scopulibacillus daqui]|uniref:ATP synthase subunit delta n=1 Tax=Scopulibacillus daqui TaxID=1469162 RepID=A0ABS2PZ95_9BACL|nr:F0F1 ATP synthase subunit delta [Scopulibacillus daqui]MBM7645363.1 F-type H+-transporting ATPase subunit delta [Scopulibacillus daqui]
MSEAVAERYARALFEVAKERETVDAVEEQCQLVGTTINQHRELKSVLSHPQIDSKDKKAIIEQVFKKEVNEEVVNLLKVLIDHHREGIFNDVVDEFTAMANQHRGIVEVVVTTATPLKEKEKEKLAETLGQTLNKKLRIKTKVDPDVIGGLLVRIGNRLYDGTMAGKLARFKQELKVAR